jgi:hypothetical protein
MLRIIKWLIYLVVLAAIALIAYAYLGPLFGVDFTPERREIREPVVLDGT